MSEVVLRPVTAADRDWVRALMREHWGDEIVVVNGHVHRPHELPGFIAEDGDEKVGLITYNIDGDACEVVSLNALRSGMGIGTMLIDAVREAAIAAGCRRLWLITTNDNVDALRFYQRRGFVLAALRPGEIARSRLLKPKLPEIGLYDIPIRDELELEQILTDA